MAEEKTVTIRCKQIRAGGTKVPLMGKIHHFKPDDADKANPEAPHVCAIPFSEAGAIYRLLAIKEGFELADPNAELPPRPTAKPGETVVIGNTKPVEEKKPILVTVGDKEVNLAELSAEDLRVLARDTFKVQVHHKWTDQTVISKIVEKTRGE